MADVKLFISPAENRPGHYLVVVNGEGFFNKVGERVGARIRGADPVFDDSLFGLGSAFIVRVGQNGSFTLSDTVPASKLDEDWGKDEIYAIVEVGNSEFRTNTVTGRF